MEINIGTVITILVVLVSINISLVMTGIAPLSKAAQGSIISGSSYSNINTTYNSGSLNTYEVDYSVDNQNTASDSTDLLTAGSNFVSDLISGIKTFISLISNLLFGYRYIFIALHLPVLAVWLFTGILGFITVGCLLYLAAYVSSIIRGTQII